MSNTNSEEILAKFNGTPIVERIEELTPEQEQLLPIMRDLWIKHGLSTEPADRKKAEAAVLKAYASQNLHPPQDILWVDSPMAGHKLHCKLREVPESEWITPFYGQHEASWLAFYDTFRRLGLECVQKLEGLIELGQTCGWVWFFDTTTICTERPCYLETDSRDRLHSLTRKAIEYPDGWGIYVIHGVQVQEKVILHPEQITLEDISEQRNAEVRRILVSRYGESRYILDSGAKCISTDEFGELYQTEQANDEPLCMVKVINSTPEEDGTRKVYWLRVPPTVKTPQEAVAWTFNLASNDYQPTIQT